MLCRRCGMESSTTEVCEWCNRPMLNTGTAAQANGTQAAAAEAAAPPEGLQSLEHTGVQDESEEATAAAEEQEVLLRPLGHGEEQAAPADGKPGIPSHGLSSDATQTSIDISEYMAGGQSIFRPIEKDEGFSSASSLDRVTQKKAFKDQAQGPQMSENERLIRSLITGLAVAMVFAFIQLAIQRKIQTPMLFSAIPLGSGSTFLITIKLGIITGVAFGFMLGALLVKKQWGPSAGFFIGIMVGLGSGNGIFSVIAGAISGILVGKIATKGVRRVINV